jgi:hypothetical protein
MEIFNGLFEFENEKELDEFLTNIDVLTSTKIIELAIMNFQSQGAFTLSESHTIYKCLNKIKEHANKNQGDSIHNDDTDGDINSEIRP